MNDERKSILENEGVELRTEIVNFAKTLATKYIDPTLLEACLNSRQVALFHLTNV